MNMLGMTRGGLIVLAALLAVPAWAQPIIIPLKEGSGNPRAPETTAPPVAPPQAGPSMPENLVAQSPQAAPPPGDEQHPEEAYPPPPPASR